MREAIAENNDETYQNFIENELLQIEEFMKDLTNLETGDVVDVDWLPSRGTFVFYNGQLMGNPVRGKALYDAVLSIWLGDNSLEEKLHDLTSLFVMHLSGTIDPNLCYGVIFAIYTLEKDIKQHNRIRNRILLPMNEAMKRGKNDN